MGRGRWELSALQWETGIEDADAAWNDTFMHPDAAHWLFEGSGLQFPGLTARAGLTDRTDAGVYFIRNPSAKYGFFSCRYSKTWWAMTRGTGATAARMSLVSLYSYIASTTLASPNDRSALQLGR